VVQLHIWCFPININADLHAVDTCIACWMAGFK